MREEEVWISKCGYLVLIEKVAGKTFMHIPIDFKFKPPTLVHHWAEYLIKQKFTYLGKL